MTWDLGDKSAGDSGSVSFAVTVDGLDNYADTVVDAQQGLRKNGTPVVPERSDPNAMLGAPQNTDTINFYSLGYGGSVVLGFNEDILNGAGNDLKVVETTYGNKR